MAFRVTNIQTTLAFVDQIFKQRQGLEDKRKEVGSGFKVSDASDDPASASAISQFQSTASRLGRHKERIASATGMLETQDSVLDQAEKLMLRAKELATQAANASVTTGTRAAMATEVFQIRDALLSLANTKYQGVYIYAGAVDNTPPFNASPYTTPAATSDPAHSRYSFTVTPGATLTRSVSISDVESIQVTTSGGDVFSNSIYSLERLGRTLAGYETNPATGAPDGTGDTLTFPDDKIVQDEAIRAAIDNIESARNNEIVQERTSVGSRLNRLENASGIIDAIKLNTEKARSSVQDTDIFESASELANLQTGLSALLQSGAQINQLTLLNFL